MVINYSEREHTVFFRKKKNALKYYNSHKDEGCIKLETIDVEPNKKGIMRAMHKATWAVGIKCVDSRER